VQERARQSQPLVHALAERAHLVVRTLLEAKLTEQPLHTVGQRVFRDAVQVPVE